MTSTSRTGAAARSGRRTVAVRPRPRFASAGTSASTPPPRSTKPLATPAPRTGRVPGSRAGEDRWPRGRRCGARNRPRSLPRCAGARWATRERRHVLRRPAGADFACARRAVNRPPSPQPKTQKSVISAPICFATSALFPARFMIGSPAPIARLPRCLACPCRIRRALCSRARYGRQTFRCPEERRGRTTSAGEAPPHDAGRVARRLAGIRELRCGALRRVSSTSLRRAARRDGVRRSSPRAVRPRGARGRRRAAGARELSGANLCGSAPAMTAANGEVYLAWRALNTALWWTAFDGSAWSPQDYAVGDTDDPPALASLGAKVYLAWRGPGTTMESGTRHSRGRPGRRRRPVPGATTKRGPGHGLLG